MSNSRCDRMGRTVTYYIRQARVFGEACTFKRGSRQALRRGESFTHPSQMHGIIYVCTRILPGGLLPLPAGARIRHARVPHAPPNSSCSDRLQALWRLGSEGLHPLEGEGGMDFRPSERKERERARRDRQRRGWGVRGGRSVGGVSITSFT